MRLRREVVSRCPDCGDLVVDDDECPCRWATESQLGKASHGFGLIWVGVLVFFAVVTALLEGCGHAPPLVTDHVTTVTVREKCADLPTPKFVPVPPPTECQAGLLCYTVPDAAALRFDVEVLLEWMRTTERLCAPASK